MNTVEFGMWRPELFDVEIRKISDGAIDRIILYAQQEFEYTVFQYFEFLSDYSDKHDIPFYIIICTSAYVNPLHDVTNSKYRNIKIQHWGTYFLSEVLIHLTGTGDHLKTSSEPFKYPYISMNCKPHYHRCLMMDILAKYDLIERGAVSWLEVPYGHDTPGVLPSISRGHPYKYWTPSIKRLTEVDPDQFNIFCVPAEYKQSFVQLVVESCDRLHMVSEKSWMPIFYKKPFIALATQHHHALLQSYGFKMYDEYFDYSFDSEPDLNLRAEAIARNIQRYANKPPIVLEKIYKRLLPKLEYNYNLALSLAKDAKLVPEIIMEAPDNNLCSPHVVKFIIDSETQ